MTKSQVMNLGSGISLFCHSERMRGILTNIVSKISPPLDMKLPHGVEMTKGAVKIKEGIDEKDRGTLRTVLGKPGSSRYCETVPSNSL